ncbi:MAG: zinc ribbon domain-containing protein [Fimbriimonadaceae bacterium]
MSTDRLKALWKLHLVDDALHRAGARYEHADQGEREIAEFKELAVPFKQLQSEAAQLELEITELEKQVAMLKRKQEGDQSTLYNGSVKSAKEAETLEHEIESIGSRLSELEPRLADLLQKRASTQEEVSAHRKRLAALKKTVEEKQKNAAGEREAIKQEILELTKKRSECLSVIDLVSRQEYDRVLSRTHDTAMAEVTSTGVCGACGTKLPRKTIDLVAQGHLLRCESCSRILYRHPVTSVA